MRIRLALIVVLILSVAPIVTSAASAADRFALVIGNANYPNSEAPLKEPINDAREIAEELKHDGFTVEIGENLTGEAMRRAFERLNSHIKPGTVALIFFSGFGIQSNRQSYLIPVDAAIWYDSDVRKNGISLEAVLGDLNSRGAGIKIALIDASRRNPFERQLPRSYSAGLAPVIAPNGTLVMYSAGLSSVVPDNGADHSLFVQELLKEIRVPGLMAEEALNRTRVGVTRASRSQQVPWISSSLVEDFSFIPGSGEPPPPPPPPIIPPKPAEVVKPGSNPEALPQKPETADIPKKPEEPKPEVAIVTPADVAPGSLEKDPTIIDLNARLAKNPNDANAHYRRGQVYASKGAYGLAIKDFDETLRVNQKDVEAYNNRCWARTVVGDLQAALRDCNEALRLRPNFVDALDSRGLLNLKSGQARNALADFDAALKINPGLTSSLYGRGLARQRNGAMSEGEVDMKNAIAMNPNIVKEFASYGVH
jgi:tetratricopeptide (TPR) repeat protein